MTEQCEIRSGPYRIRGILTVPGRGERFPCVILSHGLISSKESSKYVALSQALQAAGVASCRFDYQGCGESEGNIEETTLTARVANLDAVAEWVLGHPSVDAGNLGLLGSSFGGSTSLVKASRDRRVRCLCLWATPYLLEKNRVQGDPLRGFCAVRSSGRGDKGLMRPCHPRGGRRGGPQPRGKSHL
jgi:hypothetical protein